MIEILIVCTDPERGRYTAFERNAPQTAVHNYSREAALYGFISKYGQRLGVTVRDLGDEWEEAARWEEAAKASKG